MYSLTIHFGPNAVVWSFLFKDKDPASYALSKCMAPGETFYILEDDFGQRAHINPKQIHGVMLEDMDLVEEARILRSLANARGEVKARSRAMSDPVIRTAQAGPGVIAPNFGRN
jgi:hypothetical protein